MTPDIEDEIPRFRLNRDMIDGITTLFEKYGQMEKPHEVVAPLLGHSSEKSSTYRYRLASMRKFGLIEGKGGVRVSDLGARIAMPKSEREFTRAIATAVQNVTPWRVIFQKYTIKGESLPKDDFWSILFESFGYTVQDAKDKANTIREKYVEDTRLIDLQRGLYSIPEVEEEKMTHEESKKDEIQETEKSPTEHLESNFLPFTFPKGSSVKIYGEEPEKEWKIIRRSIDSYFGINEDKK